MGYTEKIVVIGAGISGLACAFRLKQFGLHPIVLEAGERPGGLLHSVRRNGFLFETGPQCPRFPESVLTRGAENRRMTIDMILSIRSTITPC